MTIISEERTSDSPFVEAIIHGRTESDGFARRPSELHWHLVFVRHGGRSHAIVVGPLTTAGIASWGEGAEIMWIKFKLGAFMPRFPFGMLRDKETILPEAARRNSFWLNDSAWRFPDYENAEAFVNRLVRQDVLVRDPVVDAVLQGHPQAISPRTVRHHFLRATGLTRGHIRQAERANMAAALLQQGSSILDTVFEAGYFDQSHLTRSLKHFIGYTPAQLILPGLPT
jgi:hypothetical protein